MKRLILFIAVMFAITIVQGQGLTKSDILSLNPNMKMVPSPNTGKKNVKVKKNTAFLSATNKTASCIDTIYYPHSKMTSFDGLAIMDNTSFTSGISQTYAANTGLIHGIRAFVAPDDNGVPGDGTPVNLQISVMNVDALNKPTTVIASEIVNITDLGNVYQNLMFTTPVAVAGRYAVVVELDPLTAAVDTAYYMANSQTAGDGAGEGLMGIRLFGAWYNFYTEFGSYDADALLSPIFEKDITANFTTVADTVCLGEEIVFNNTSTIDTNAMYNLYADLDTSIYSWDYGDGSGIYHHEDTNYTYGTSASFTAELVITSYGYTSNCFESIQQTVEVLAAPVVVANTDTTICVGSPLNLNASGASTYSWDNGLGAGQNHIVHPTKDTNYVVRGTDVAGCTAKDTVNVTVNPLPILTTNQDTFVCEAATVNLFATGAATYVWDNGLGAGANHAVAPAANTTYAVTGTDALGCSNSTSVLVSVGNCLCTDTIYYPQSKTTAFDGLAIMDVTSFTSAVSQTFSANTGLVHGIRAFVVPDNNGVAGDGTPVNLEISVMNVDALNRPTTVIASEIVNITDIGNVEQNLLFASPVAVAGKYAVVVGLDPLTAADDTAYYMANNQTLGDGGGEGLMGIRLFGTWYNFYTEFGSYDSDVLLAPIFQKTITANYTTDADSVCVGLPVTFTNNSVLDTNYMYNRYASLNTDLYKWNYNDGTGTYNHKDTTYTFANAGVFNTDLLITNYGYTTNCYDTLTRTVTVVEATVLASNDTAICLGDSITISASGANTYTWNNGLGAGQSHKVSPTADTSYVVTGTNSFGCSTTDTVMITVNSLPTIVASTDTSICIGATVQLSATGATTYTWDNGLGAGQNQTATPTVNTSYVVTGTDVLGCSNIDTVDVVINTLPIIQANTDTIVCTGDAVNLSATGGVSYTWNNGLGAGQNHSLIPIQDTNYVVTGTDVNGCVGTDTVYAAIAPCNCVDTVYYPHSKMTALDNLKIMDVAGGINGVAQTFDATTGLIYGLNAFVVPDNNGIAGDAASLEMLISIANVDAQNRPTTVIASNLVTVYDVGNQEQPLLFTNPVAVTGRYAVMVELNPATEATDTAYYMTNNQAANDGAGEGLMTIKILNAWFNRYNQLGTDNVDALFAPIVDKTLTANFTTDVDSVCLGGDIVFTNTSTIDTNSMYNRYNALGTNIYNWNYDDGTGSYAHVDTTYTYGSTGTYNSQLLITNYGYTNNCVDSVAQTIEVLDVTVTASIDTTVCAGDTIFLSATGADTYVWDNGLGAGANHAVVGTIDTAYVVTGTDLFGCSAMDTVNVTVNPLPVVVASIDTTVCTGDTVFLSATGADSFDWDNGLGAGANHTVVGTIDTAYVVTGTDLLGCTAMDTVNVTVNPLPVVLASIDTAVCAGDTVYLSATGVATYDWDNGLGAGANHAVVGTIDTAYVVTGTDLLGCTAMDTVNVTVNPLSVVLASIDTAVCAGDTIFLSATGAATYVWDNGLGAGANHSVVGTIDTAYVVTGTDLFGCSAMDTVNVTVNPLPVVVTSIDTAVCAGDTIFLSATGADTYVWDNGLGAGANHAVVGTIDTAYVVTGTDLLGCTAMDTVNVTVNPLPVVLASIDTAVCAGDTVYLSATGADSFDWDNGLGAGANHAIVGTIDTAYVVTGTNLLGCTAMDTVNVTVNPLPVVLASIDTAVCAGDTIFLSATGADTYVWDNGLGAGANHAVVGTIDTAYVVTGTDLLSCTATDTVNVTINQLPVVLASVDTTVCTGDTVFLSATGAITYDWDNGLGAGQFQNTVPVINTMYVVTGTDAQGCLAMDTVNAAIDTIPVVLASIDTAICVGDTVFLSATGATTYEWDSGLGIGQSHNATPIVDAVFVVTGSNVICSSTDTVVVTVNALPSVTASNDDTICAGDTVTISAMSTVTPYVWDNGLDTLQQHDVNPTTTTTYVVAVTGTNNCVGTDTVVINVNALPMVTTTPDLTLCENDTVFLSATGAATYVWDNGLGAGVSHTILTPIDTTYWVSGTDTNGCIAADSINVTINEIALTASNDTIICLGQSVTISANGAISYEWNNGLGSGEEHTVTPEEQTVYIVTGENNGCFATETVIVTVDNKCFKIPNVFTPNGDGKNDVWNIGGLFAFPEITVKVFNRWGDLVFESETGYTKPWDGKYNGTDVPSATYYYIIDLGGGEEAKSGTINIVR